MRRKRRRRRKRRSLLVLVVTVPYLGHVLAEASFAGYETVEAGADLPLPGLLRLVLGPLAVVGLQVLLVITDVILEPSSLFQVALGRGPFKQTNLDF